MIQLANASACLSPLFCPKNRDPACSGHSEKINKTAADTRIVIRWQIARGGGWVFETFTYLQDWLVQCNADESCDVDWRETRTGSE